MTVWVIEIIFGKYCVPSLISVDFTLRAALMLWFTCFIVFRLKMKEKSVSSYLEIF